MDDIVTNINTPQSLSSQTTRLVPDYTFDPVARVITISNKDCTILTVINQTANRVIFNPLVGIGGEEHIKGQLTLTYDTSSMAPLDKLLIMAEYPHSTDTQILINILDTLRTQVDLIEEILSS